MIPQPYFGSWYYRLWWWAIAKISRDITIWRAWHRQNVIEFANAIADEESGLWEDDVDTPETDPELDALREREEC